MNQFTRSLIYSTAVVALGLGAVIAIYSDTKTDLSAIEPAAGIEILQDNVQEPILSQTSYVSEIPANVKSDMKELVDSADENAKEILAEIEDIMNSAEEMAQQAAENMGDIAPAAGHEDSEEEEEETHEEDHQEEHGEEHH